MKTEESEFRFGALAVKKGFVTPDHVIKALALQVKGYLSTGEHKRIGKILHEQQFITLDQLDEIILASNS